MMKMTMNKYYLIQAKSLPLFEFSPTGVYYAPKAKQRDVANYMHEHCDPVMMNNHVIIGSESLLALTLKYPDLEKYITWTEYDGNL